MPRTRSCVLLFLLFVLPLVLCDQGFPQAGVPPGYQLLTDPQMSGGLLIAQRQEVTAATPLLRLRIRRGSDILRWSPPGHGGCPGCL